MLAWAGGLFLALVLGTSVAAQEPAADEFLAELGSSGGGGFDESVDLFSGILTIRQTEVALPGRSGVNLVLQRYYRSNVWNRVESGTNPAGGSWDDLIYFSAGTDSHDLLGGAGWQLHFGKVINPWGSGSAGNAQIGADNPVVVMPDGSTHPLYNCSPGNSLFPCRAGDLISAGGWRYRQISPPRQYPVQWELLLRDGTRYIFSSPAQRQQFRPGCAAGPCYSGITTPRNATSYLDILGRPVAQAVFHRDRHGNQIEMRYDGVGGRLTEVVDSWGRVLEFSYVGSPSAGHFGSFEAEMPRLANVRLRAGNTTLRTWFFYYAPSTFTVDYELLSGVTRTRRVRALTAVGEPIGRPWRYAYRTSGSRSSGLRALTSVTLPSGGEVGFSYGSETFDVGERYRVGGTFATTLVEQLVVRTRSRSGPQVPGATWAYEYHGTDGSGPRWGMVRTPATGTASYREVVDFHSWRAYESLPPAVPGSPTYPDRTDGEMWLNGLPWKRTVSLDWSGANSWKRQTVTEFHYRQGEQISSDLKSTTGWNNFASARLGRVQRGVAAALPRLTRTTTRQREEGTVRAYTVEQDLFDAYGNPRRSRESGGVPRTTTTEWHYDADSGLTAGQPAYRQAVPGQREQWWYYGSGLLADHVAGASARLNSPAATNGGVWRGFSYYPDGLPARETTRNQSTRSHDLVTEFQQYWYGAATRIHRGNSLTNIRFEHRANALGQLTGQDDGRGNIAWRRYDAIGRLIEIDPPGHASGFASAPSATATAVVTYEEATSTTGPRIRRMLGGHEILFELDGFGRLVRRVDLETGDEQLRSYDTLGTRRREETRPGGEAGEVRIYDLLGRLVSIARPAGTVSYSYRFSGSRQVVRVTNERGHTTELEYELFGTPEARRLSAVTDAAGNSWTYGYDGQGLLVSVDAPGTAADRSFSYSSEGWLLSETHPESGTTRFQYTPAGQLGRRTNAEGQWVDRRYDVLGRLRKLVYSGPTPHDVSFTYDGPLRSSMRMSATTADRIDYAYDVNGRLIRQTTRLGSRDHTVRYEYDRRDRLRTMTYPSGRRIEYTYEAGQRIDSVEDLTLNRFLLRDATYAPAGGVTGYQLEGGVATAFGYDAGYRLSEIDVSAPGETVLDLSFVHDGVGNLTSWTDNAFPASSRSFGYDDLDRLETATAASLWGTKGFEYDAHGNRTAVTLGGERSTYGYAGNRLTTVTEGTGAESLRFTYDDAGRALTATREMPDPDDDPPPPPDTFMARFTTAVSGLQVTFSPQPTSPHEGLASLAWDFGDGRTAQTTDPLAVVTHRYAASGTYSVTLIATWAGGRTDDYTAQVEVVAPDAPPRASFTFDECPGLVCAFDASASTDDRGIAVYRWDFGDGTPAFETGLPEVTHEFSAAEEYTVRLTVIDDAGQADTASSSVPVGVVPIVDIPPRTRYPLRGSDRRAGILVVPWRFMSPVGIASVEFDTGRGMDSQGRQIGNLGVRHRKVDPKACVDFESVHGWRPPDCPGVLWEAIVDTRAIFDDRFGHLDPQPSCWPLFLFWRVTDNLGRTKRFTGELPCLGQPIDVRAPRVGITRVASATYEDAKKVRIEGWTFDDTGVLPDLEVRINGVLQPQRAEAGASPAPGLPTVQSICRASPYGTPPFPQRPLLDPNCSLEDEPLGFMWSEFPIPASGLRIGETFTVSVTARDTWGRTWEASVEDVFDPDGLGHDPRWGSAFRPTLLDRDGDLWLAASHFNVGGNGQAYSDSSPGNHGNHAFRPGEDVDLFAYVPPLSEQVTRWVHADLFGSEWLAFDVVVAEEGYWVAEFDFADTDSTGRLRLRIDGVDVTGQLETFATPPPGPDGAPSFSKVVSEPFLVWTNRPELLRTFRVEFPQGGFDFSGLRLRPVAPPPPESFGAIAHALPGTFRSKEFDRVPAGPAHLSAYSDLSLANELPEPCRSTEGVECGRIDGRDAVVLSAGEWTGYRVQPTRSGVYDLDVFYRNETDSTQHLRISAGSRPRGMVALPPTGPQWGLQQVAGLTLASGSQQIRLSPASGSDGILLDRIQIRDTVTPPPPCETPIARADVGFVVPAGASHTFSIADDLLANDDPVQAYFVGADDPTAGAIAVHGDALTYTAPASGVESATFRYTVATAPICTAEATVSIDVDTPPVPAFSAACAGLTCTFDGRASEDDHPGLTYRWAFGDGGAGSGATAQHTYPEPAAYTAVLEVTDSIGQTRRATAAVPLALPPVADFSVSCDELSCDFDASGSTGSGGSLTFQWAFGDGTTSPPVASSTMSHTYAGSGQYVVTLVVSSGSLTDTEQKVVSPHARPTAVLAFHCDELHCRFDASGSSDDLRIVEYEWDFGDGTRETTGEPGIFHEYPEEGTYHVVLTVRDVGGLTGSADAAPSVDEFVTFLLTVTGGDT